MNSAGKKAVSVGIAGFGLKSFIVMKAQERSTHFESDIGTHVTVIFAECG